MKAKSHRKILTVCILFAFTFLVSISSVLASGVQNESTDWSAPVTYIKIVAYFTIILSLFITLTPWGKNLSQTHKTFFFLLLFIPIVGSSLYLAGHTIHENIVSETKGPIHWHADYEVWLCDEKVDLIDPRGLKNKIGTPLFHEHNDDRIHVEGTIMQLADIDLGSYFGVIGGELTDTKITFNIEDIGPVTYENGDKCLDGSVGELGVYVNGNRINDVAHYQISQEVYVPDGDCIIFEFGSQLGDTTEHICPSWVAKDVTYESFHAKKAEVTN